MIQKKSSFLEKFKAAGHDTGTGPVVQQRSLSISELPFYLASNQCHC